jgi:tetratricopeptide (TPR) repeat protein
MKHNDYQHAIVAYAKAGETKLLYNLGDKLIKEGDIDGAKAAYQAAIESDSTENLRDKYDFLCAEERKVKNNGRDPITLARLGTLLDLIGDVLVEKDGIKEAS